MVMVVSAKNKVGFTDGTYPEPEKDDANRYLWVRGAQSPSSIFNSISR